MGFFDMSGQPGIASAIVNRAPWWIPWLFLFIMLLGFVAYQFTAAASTREATIEARATIREASIAGCERINILRQETNKQTEVLRDVLRTAADSAISRGEGETAALYLEHLNNLRTHEVVDCEEAYPEEMQRAGMGVSGAD